MAGARDQEELFGLGSLRISILAEFKRVRLVSRDEQKRARRDCLDVVEGVEVEELDVARHGRLGRAVGVHALGGELAAARAVKVKELDRDRVAVLGDLSRCAAGHLDLAALGLGPSGSGRLGDHPLALLDALRLVEPIAVHGAHVVHAGRGDGLDARVDLGRADDVAAAGADSQGADALAVDRAHLRSQVVDGRAVDLCELVRRRAVARLALAAAPVREVQRHGHEALLGELGRVEVGGLLLGCAHGVADHDGGRVGVGAEVGQGEEVARDGQVVLSLEIDGLDCHNIALVPVVCAKG